LYEDQLRWGARRHNRTSQWIIDDEVVRGTSTIERLGDAEGDPLLSVWYARRNKGRAIPVAHCRNRGGVTNREAERDVRGTTARLE
jgi:hypothetical protein